MKLLLTIIVLNFFNQNMSHAKSESNPVVFEQWNKLSHQEYLSQSITCQLEVKKYFWNNQKWPDDNINNKSNFSHVFSIDDMKKISNNNLRKETMLLELFGIEINDSLLQNELNRIIAQTGSKEKLSQLFALLNNDPSHIIECIVRPSLVNHLIWKNQDSNLLKRVVLTSFPKSQYMLKTEFYLSNNATDSDQNNLLGNTPASRSSHTAIWTGTEMIVWGGRNDIAQYLGSGAKYNPITDSWALISETSSPSARRSHSAAWTGTEMIIWGGSESGNNYINTGAKYNPLNDTWMPVSLTNSPIARSGHTSIWTGSKMVIWGGGIMNSTTNTGGIYDPDLNNWVATPMLNAPSARSSNTAIWTGTDMIVWGGSDGEGFFFDNDGSLLNLTNLTWTEMTNSNAPSPRIGHQYIWTGTEMIVWGGFEDSLKSINTGGKYNPSTNTWSDTTTLQAPSSRNRHSAIWTGTEMIVWGGNYSNTGARYSPNSDSWTPTNLTNAPSPRDGHTAIWNGTSMIVWGGFDESLFDVVDGSHYYPASDSWIELEDTLFMNGFE